MSAGIKETESYLIGDRFAKTGDPRDAIWAIETARDENQPLHPAIADWLITAFNDYRSVGVPFEKSFDLEIKQGGRSRIGQLDAEMKACARLSEMLWLQLKLKISMVLAAEMVALRTHKDWDKWSRKRRIFNYEIGYEKKTYKVKTLQEYWRKHNYGETKRKLENDPEALARFINSPIWTLHSLDSYPVEDLDPKFKIKLSKLPAFKERLA